MRRSCPMVPWQFFTIFGELLKNRPYEYLLASVTAPKAFANSSPSLVKFWFFTDSIHWIVRSCTTEANWWLFRDSLLSSAVFKSPISSVRGLDPFRSLWKLVRILCFHFCITTFEASPSESEFSLSDECTSTYISRSSRSTVKGCNQSGIPCAGSSLYNLSEKCSCAGSRLPVACVSGSVSIGFPHACLSLRVVTGSDNSPKCLE